MGKRPIRKARRKVRREKVKTLAQRWRENFQDAMVELDQRVKKLEEIVMPISASADRSA